MCGIIREDQYPLGCLTIKDCIVDLAERHEEAPYETTVHLVKNLSTLQQVDRDLIPIVIFKVVKIIKLWILHWINTLE